MRTSLGQMDGNAWEDYCQKLLRIRYQDYQKVPDQFGGDLGIEGFTLSGIVFQCYCPDDDLHGKELYENQRDKITKDINKLAKNAESISTLGVGLITEWQFITPDYKSRHLIAHCRIKESEILSKKITVISSNFKILLKIEDDFIPERQIYLGSGLKVQPTEEDSLKLNDELKNLLLSTNSIVLNIKTKLAKLPLSSNHISSMLEQFVKNYVIGKYELEKLNINPITRVIDS